MFGVSLNVITAYIWIWIFRQILFICPKLSKNLHQDMKGAKVEGRTPIRELTSRILNFFFIQFFFHTHFTDAQCGFKGVTKKVVVDLIPKVKDNGWFFDGELLIIAEKSGYKIYEEPVHWIDNPGSTVRLISTIWGDLMSIKRLLQTQPWKIR